MKPLKIVLFIKTLSRLLNKKLALVPVLFFVIFSLACKPLKVYREAITLVRFKIAHVQPNIRFISNSKRPDLSVEVKINAINDSDVYLCLKDFRGKLKLSTNNYCSDLGDINILQPIKLPPHSSIDFSLILDSNYCNCIENLKSIVKDIFIKKHNITFEISGIATILVTKIPIQLPVKLRKII